MIDLIDFGCGDGLSTKWALKKFGGETSLGINNRHKEHNEAMLYGHNQILADLTDMDYSLIPECRYVSMSHLLEHLADESEVEKVINVATQKATEFVFIKGPTFEKMDYLADLGFRITWTNWIGHPTAVNEQMLKRILDKTGLEYHIGFSYPIVNSHWREIIPLSAPVDTIWYSAGLGVRDWKPFYGVYREIYCYIKTGDCDFETLIKTDIL